MARRRWKINDIEKIVSGENPYIQSGYTGKKGERKIGEEWQDAKGSWKKTKNGIVRVNKQMDLIRELIKSKCSICNMDINLFGDNVDRKIHAKTGKCFACLDIYEQNLKLQGKYEFYEESKILKNRLSALEEFKKNVIESIDYLKKDDSKLEMVCSNGDVVTWTGSQNNKLLKEAEHDLELCKQEILKVSKEIETLENKLESSHA